MSDRVTIHFDRADGRTWVALQDGEPAVVGVGLTLAEALQALRAAQVARATGAGD